VRLAADSTCRLSNLPCRKHAGHLSRRGCRDTVAARILRPPSTLNHKHAPPAPVTLLAHRPEGRYALGELLAGLPTTRAGQRSVGNSSRPTARRTALDRELLAIPARHYVAALTGRGADRTGKVACPFHDDRTPSLQLYGDGTFYCFGCARGGTIYDFAAHLWSTGTRNGEFLALRERLQAHLVRPLR